MKISREVLAKRYPESDPDFAVMLVECKLNVIDYRNIKKQEIEKGFKKSFEKINEQFDDYFIKKKRNYFDKSDKQFVTKIIKEIKDNIKKSKKDLLSNYITIMEEVYNYQRLYMLWMLDTKVENVVEFEKPLLGEMDDNKKKEVIKDPGFSKSKLKKITSEPVYGKTFSERLDTAAGKAANNASSILSYAINNNGKNNKDYLNTLKQLNNQINEDLIKKAAYATDIGIDYAEDIAYQDIFQNNPYFLRKFQRVEILDNKSCLLCASLDGTTYEKPLGLIHPHCFPQGILITTNDGDKDISEIKIGDIVLTHKDNMKKVLKLFVNQYSGKLIKLWFDNNTYLLATPNHKVYVLDENGNECWKEIDLINVGEKVVTKC